jgi:Fe-S-cluster containining protein
MTRTIIRNYRAPAASCWGQINKNHRGWGPLESLLELKLKTDCDSCVHKCCSQPYDWVFLTKHEIARLEAASGLVEHQFVAIRRNANTNHVFRTLNLPCHFLDAGTGRCNVYESRPLICKLFPFYLEPMTGHATLLPIQCGPNLQILSSDSDRGWRLQDFEEAAKQWLAELWKESEVME